jgi:class 3 adenylate cyclase/tetratricopeptide (TPR) repeat protein
MSDARVVSTSVVFTDLVGSTEMASRLGPGATEAVRQIHFNLLRNALATTGGTEVKNLGDGLMVVFNSLGAALDGAVAMQQAVARHNEKGSELLAIRVGVSTGDATTEEGDYFGPPVVEASRLCAKAEGGQILTTEMVSRLARASEHSFTSVGELELKGIPEPVVCMEVGWAAGADPSALRIPLPSRFAVPVLSALVGRQAEWEVLEQARKAASAGNRQVVLVAGEPGVGKTRLTSALSQGASELGTVVLYGRCDEELGVPYQPWVEAIGHLVENLPEDLLAAHVADHGGHLVRLAPQITRRLANVPSAQASDPETERYLLFQAVTGLIGQVTAKTPVLLLLEDLHWADKPSLMLLRHLVGQSEVLPLLILGTYRDSDVSKGSALSDTLAALRRESGVERMALTGLDDAGVLALLESVAGHALDEASLTLAHAIGRETAGNPFFVGEILRYLSEVGTIYQRDDGRWAVRADMDGVFVPESVREVVGQRVGRLGEDVVRVLRAASVIGRDFDLAVLARVLDEPESEVYDQLEQAQTAALVHEVIGVEDRFTFRHALVQHSLDADLTARHRRQLHQRVAEVLEEACGADPGDRVGELATHWLAATVPVSPTKALHYARLAGERALAQLAPDEAVRWFTAAIDLIAQDQTFDAEQKCSLLVGLGNAQRQAGIPAYRQTLLDCGALAQQIGDTAALVSAALANNRGMMSSLGTADEDRIGVLRAALEAVGNGDSPERAKLLTILAIELAFIPPFSARVELADEAAAIARRLGDVATLAEVLVRPYLALLLPETAMRRWNEVNEARTLAAQIDDPFLRFWTAIWCSNSALEFGRIADVDFLLEEAAAIAEEVQQPMLEWVLTLNLAMRACVAGDTDEAERLATLALEIATETGQPDGFTFYGTQLMAIRRFQGRSEEVLPIIAQVAADNPAMSVYKAALAANQCEANHHDDARTLLEESYRAGFDLPRDAAWSTAMVSWAAVAADLQLEDVAAALYPLLLPFEEHVPTTGLNAMPPFAVSLGELAAARGLFEDAERHFEVAERISAGLEAPYFLARTYLGWATALQRAGRIDQAQTLARKALDQSQGAFGMIDRRATALVKEPLAKKR